MKLQEIIVYEYDDSAKVFKEIEKKLPLHTNLDSDKIILFVDTTRDRVWHWRGHNTNPEMQSLARKSVVPSIRESFLLKKFPNFDIVSTREKFLMMSAVIHMIDEGNEPSDFKVLVGLMEEPVYPEFKVNDILTLKLIDDKTFIYIKGKKFIQCMRLFLQIPPQKSNLYEEIESIDEATEVFDKFLFMNRIVKSELQEPVENHNYTITPEQEFWGHCSNLQAWVEHEYDTRLLHSNLSFPLLKKLSDAGDQFALLRFKEEIAIRLEAGYLPVIRYLIEENYIRYLSPDWLIDFQKKYSGRIIPRTFKVLNRNNRDQQRSLKEYSKLRSLKYLLYVPHIIDQLNPKEFVIGLSSLDFTFLDFFLSPNIENKEMYFVNLLDRLLNGLRSKDFLFHKATKHFIERIIKYFLRYIFPSKKEIKSHKLIETDVHKSNVISIIWLLEKIFENEWENIIIQNISYFTSFSESKSQIKTQLDLIEDVVSFRNFLNRLLENSESQKNIQQHDPKISRY